MKYYTKKDDIGRNVGCHRVAEPEKQEWELSPDAPEELRGPGQATGGGPPLVSLSLLLSGGALSCARVSAQ